MRVDELPSRYATVFVPSARNAKRKAHLSTGCRSFPRGNVYAKKRELYPELDVCEFCLRDDELVSYTPSEQHTGPGPSKWDRLNNDIDVEAAMLEHAPQEQQ